MKRIILGLTGLIGSGKTMVADLLKQCGAEIIDTDLIAHELTDMDGGAIHPIIHQFGRDYINHDGALDREKMRNLVFNDENARKSLEAILHELIYDEVVLRLKKEEDYRLVVIVVPLLFKALKYLQLIDYTVFVDCDEKILFDRVKLRSNLPENIISNILLAQMPRDEQLKLADYVIENNGSVEELKEKVIKFYNDFFIC